MLASPTPRAGRAAFLMTAVTVAHVLLLQGHVPPLGRALPPVDTQAPRVWRLTSLQDLPGDLARAVAAAQVVPSAEEGSQAGPMGASRVTSDPAPDSASTAMPPVAAPERGAPGTGPGADAAGDRGRVAAGRASTEGRGEGEPLADDAALVTQAEIAPPLNGPAQTWPAGPAEVQALAQMLRAPATPTAPPLSGTAEVSGSNVLPPEGQLPPLVPTPPLPAARWLYQARRGPASGNAWLTWQPGPPDGSEARYELHLAVQLDGRTVWDWTSRGDVTATGLAPQRMVERQRGREVQAVNFQRDKGLISYAGPSHTDPLLPGTQDRLSWVLQLVALAQAQGGLVPGQVLHLPVAGPRGDAQAWHFTVLPIEWRQMNGRTVPLTPLVREPARPYDHRVQLWLARQHDHLPVGLSWTVVPGGEPLALWLESLPSGL